MREKVSSDVGVALSVAQQVNAACMIIQNSLANLAEVQLSCAKVTWPETCVGHLFGVEAQNQKTLLLGPVNTGGGGREAEGHLGDMLGVTGSPKALPVYSGDVEGEMENRSGELLYGAPLPTKGKANTLTKTEETPFVKRCGNDGSSLKCSDKDLLNNHNQSLCEEGIEDNLVLERRTDGTREEDAGAKEGFKSPERVQRIRALWELGVTSAQPRRMSKGGQGTLQYGIRSSSRLSLCSKTGTDSDIINCNNRLRVEWNDTESVKLWGTGKHLGMKCSGNEEAVIREMDCMEVRDNEVMMSSEEDVGVL